MRVPPCLLCEHERSSDSVIASIVRCVAACEVNIVSVGAARCCNRPPSWARRLYVFRCQGVGGQMSMPQASPGQSAGSTWVADFQLPVKEIGLNTDECRCVLHEGSL